MAPIVTMATVFRMSVKMGKYGLHAVVLVLNDVILHRIRYVKKFVSLDVSVRRVMYWMQAINVLSCHLALLFLQRDATEHHVE